MSTFIIRDRPFNLKVGGLWSEYFFQQHWESEYFFRQKNITPPPFKLIGRSLISVIPQANYFLLSKNYFNTVTQTQVDGVM